MAFGKSFLLGLLTLLPIINPLATAPIFLDLTHGLGDPVRERMAMRIGQNIIQLLVGSMLVGSYLLKIFGISLAVIEVAGGLVVTSIAWRLLNAQQVVSDDKSQLAQTLNENNVRMRTLYPMTFPIACGPGSIAGAIAVGASLKSDKLSETAINLSGGVVAMILIGLLVGFVLRYAQRLLTPLGEVRQVVFLRLMAFLLLAIGIQIFWDGMSELLLDLLVVAA